MPKIVDHDQRRVELVEATWRIIARLGLDGATMREVAAEAGFANGALKPYFPTKSELVQATFEYVFSRTNARVERATGALHGLDALRAFALEVLPLDATRIDEARVVLPFWQLAVHDRDKAGLNDDAMDMWRAWIRDWLDQARAERKLRTGVVIAEAAEVLLTFLLGAQVTATLDPRHASPAKLTTQLDSQLALLAV